ncbi:PGR5-like protein 1A, chloroplastic [Salvia divinorum]|uniref:PGR5-like protein 1A, chloroplastic n=1 Tax=Salvia divinorum TaxID=28513 RepID=A0ABD1HP56_SALDI
MQVYSDLSIDYLKMFLLNVPAAVVALGLFFFLDDIIGFEITYLLELPEPFSFIFTWFAALPLIIWLSFTHTNAVVKDVLILEGVCPNYGTENNSSFGSILSISSGGSTHNVKCSNCGSALVYDSKTRLITLPEGSKA